MVSLKGGRGEKALPFSVRCDRFILEFKCENGAPKTYRSRLGFLQNGQEGSIRRRTGESSRHLRGNSLLPVFLRRHARRQSGAAVWRDHKIMEEVEITPEMALRHSRAQGDGSSSGWRTTSWTWVPPPSWAIVAPTGNRQFWVFAAIEEIVAANPGILE